MASMLTAAAAAAALPSVGARRHGSGRLPLAALPGRDEFVLTVRTAGPGRRGILVAVELVPQRTPWAVQATSAHSDGPTEETNPEFELVRELREVKDRSMGTKITVKMPLLNDELFQHNLFQGLIVSYVHNSFDLWADVANLFKPPTDSKLYKGLRLCAEAVISVGVRANECRATWKNVSDLVEALDLLRRLVSSTVEAPLPQDWALRWDASRSDTSNDPVEYEDAGTGMYLILQRTFLLVERDVKAMIGEAK